LSLGFFSATADYKSAVAFSGRLKKDKFPVGPGHLRRMSREVFATGGQRPVEVTRQMS
jgi:hypothetical protein